MAHKFDAAAHDPYAAAATEVEKHLFSGGGLPAGGDDQTIDALADAIVAALGDIAAKGLKYGLDSPERMRRLADAVAAVSRTVITAYQGEVDATPVFDAILHDPRLSSLTPDARLALERQIEQTRKTEETAFQGTRLPELLRYAGSLDLHVAEDVLDNQPLIVGPHPNPRPELQQQS